MTSKRTADRIAKAEEALLDATLRAAAEKLAVKFDLGVDELMEEAQEILRKYGHLITTGRNGRNYYTRMTRAIARDLGWDYEQFAREAKAIEREM